MTRVLIVAAFLLTGCATTSQVEPKLPALLTAFEAQGFSGTVLAAKDGEVIHHPGYGLADRERGIHNDTNTLYEVASLEKTFTAAAILEPEARGRLSTSDPLSRHLGEFPPAKAAATIDHLANHSA